LGLFDRFKNVTQVARYKMIADRGNGFYAWNGKLYESDIVRACIRPRVKAIGKLIPKHIRSNNKEGFKVNPEPYIRFLLEDPNPYMSGQMLQEKVATQLALNNNAFILIIKDSNGYPIELYPIPCMTVEAIYNNTGDLFLKFYFQNGKIATFPYTEIIHLRDDYNDNDIFGEPPGKALTSLMNIVSTTDQGIIKAIKNSNVVKWLLKYNQTLRPEDIKKNTEEFVNNYLSLESSTVGAAATDAKADAIQVDPKDYVPNAAQTDRTTDRIYSFFNTNKKIVQSSYNEDEWNAYYEARIEPDAMQMSNEYTRKLFTRRERGFGNKIIFEASSLQYASMSTKLNLLQMVDRGAMLPDEWRRVMNLGPIEGGDKPIRRLDTAVVEDEEIEEGGDNGGKENQCKR
jgi:HK97 family phage portal protein